MGGTKKKERRSGFPRAASAERANWQALPDSNQWRPPREARGDFLLRYGRSSLPAISMSAAPSNNRVSGERVGMSLAAVTLTVDVAALFAGFVSVFDDVTVAVFDTFPVVDGSVRTSAIVAVPPLAIVPREQETVAPPVQVP